MISLPSIPSSRSHRSHFTWHACLAPYQHSPPHSVSLPLLRRPCPPRPASQPGWTVELRTKGDTVEAVFFHPSGERVGAFANARRMALQASKAAA